MAQVLIPIPQGFRHHSTTAFAETQEAYDSYDLPEMIAHHDDRPPTRWKQVGLVSGGYMHIFPPVMSQ